MIEDIRPDVRLEELTPFDTVPHGRLDELTFFDTAPPPRKKSQMREWAESLAFTIIFVLVFTTYIAQATQVPTESMKPTIMVGDHFFLDKVAFPGNCPERLRSLLPRRRVARADIIAFKPPTGAKIPFVQRSTAVAGQTIEIVS